MAPPREVRSIAGREVRITNPDKIYFPRLGVTKLALVRYYLAVAEGAARGVARRPLILKRYPDGVETEPFYQKRAPVQRPPSVATATFGCPCQGGFLDYTQNARDRTTPGQRDHAASGSMDAAT